MRQNYALENNSPNLMQATTITAYVRTQRHIFCYADPSTDQPPVAVIPRKDFESWLQSDTDELYWPVGGPEDCHSYTLASPVDFWDYADHLQWRIYNRLNEFNSLTLQTA